jgi:hypothetical protein
MTGDVATGEVSTGIDASLSGDDLLSTGSVN